MDRSVPAAIEAAFAVPIEGWDLSWLRYRADETPPPWDFGALVRAAIDTSHLTLDIDTGGGEFLERLAPAPRSVVATEGHPPNVRVAARRLAPLAITLVQARSAPDNVDQPGTDPWTSGTPLPFADGAFDAVIDRHSSYWPSEVHRVLRTGGRFLTQQRGETGRDGERWEHLFGRPTHPHRRFDLGFATQQLQRAGLHVDRAEEAETPMIFRDLAGVVFYLRVVPWAVEGFDPYEDRDALERIHRRLRDGGDLRICGSHMLIDSVKR
jgi:SAM-dependent methyltransferase